jgi:hypothetical protein
MLRLLLIITVFVIQVINTLISSTLEIDKIDKIITVYYRSDKYKKIELKGHSLKHAIYY